MKNYIYVKDMHMFVMFWVVVYIIVILHLYNPTIPNRYERVKPSFSMLSTGGGQYGTINIEHDDNHVINAINICCASHALARQCSSYDGKL